jgi:hypothetical protein
MELLTLSIKIFLLFARMYSIYYGRSYSLSESVENPESTKVRKEIFTPDKTDKNRLKEISGREGI